MPSDYIKKWAPFWSFSIYLGTLVGMLEGICHGREETPFTWGVMIYVTLLWVAVFVFRPFPVFPFEFNVKMKQDKQK